MILAVTGGRDYARRDIVHFWLHMYNLTHGGIAMVVHGACKSGVDMFAVEWAEKACVTHTGKKYAADWRKHGRRAGPIRNRAMLFNERPEILLAFPGGAGTNDCILAAQEICIPVKRLPPA